MNHTDTPPNASLAQVVDAITALGGWRTEWIGRSVTLSKPITRLSYEPVRHRIFLTVLDDGERYGCLRAEYCDVAYLVPEVMDALALVREWQMAQRDGRGVGAEGAGL